MGSPDFAVPALRALHAAGHDDRRGLLPAAAAGRAWPEELPCPVHRAALALGLPVRTPARLRRDAAEHAAFAALGLDAAVVAAYGLILPKPMLDAPRRGCLNIHASLLPRWRGAAPIQAAILAGDTEIGVTIMRMEEGLDTGPMLLKGATPIGPRTTTPELHDALAAIGARLVLQALDQDPPAIPQPAEGATYAPKLTKQDARLDWSAGCRQPGTPGARAEPLARHVFHAGTARRSGCWPPNPPRAPARPARCWTRPPPSPAARARCGCCGCSARAAARCRRRISCAASRWPPAPAGLMPLYALTLEYDGGPFVGWQRQGNGLSVQQVLEEAAAKLNDGVPPAASPPAAPMPACMPRARSRNSPSPATCRRTGCARR